MEKYKEQDADHYYNIGSYHDLIMNGDKDVESATIFISGEIESDLIVKLNKQYRIINKYWKGKLKEINIQIDSEGGDSHIIFGFFDFVNKLKNDGVLVNTRAETICQSTATWLVAMGTGQRSAGPNCRFMIHDVQINYPEQTSSTQFNEFSEEMKRHKRDLFKFYSLLSSNEVYKNFDFQIHYGMDSSEHYLPSIEMLNLGLIDKVY